MEHLGPWFSPKAVQPKATFCLQGNAWLVFPGSFHRTPSEACPPTLTGLLQHRAFIILTEGRHGTCLEVKGQREAVTWVLEITLISSDLVTGTFYLLSRPAGPGLFFNIKDEINMPGVVAHAQRLRQRLADLWGVQGRPGLPIESQDSYNCTVRPRLKVIMMTIL